MQPRVALILGNGKYALALQRRLRCESDVAALSIALFPHGDTAVTTADHCVDLLSPTKVLRLLQDNQITHVIFGGNFNLAHISATWQTRPFHSLRSAADPRVYQLMFSLRRGVSFALTQFCNILRENGFAPTLASDYLDDLKPGMGAVIAAGRLAAMSSDEILSLTTRPAVQAVQELGSQPWRHVRQALLFDGEGLVLREATGTDALLSKAKILPKTNAPRTMMKLCPPNFDYRMDPPVVGPRTFELAAAAGVDLVVLEGAKGILFDRERVGEICRQAGITIFGLESEEFKLIQPRERAPAA